MSKACDTGFNFVENMAGGMQNGEAKIMLTMMGSSIAFYTCKGPCTV